MLSSRKNLLALGFIAFSILFGNSQDDQTEDEKMQHYKYLNSVRANFTACFIWRWQYNNCLQKCEDMGQKGQRCCILPCCLYTLGAVIENKNEDESPARATITAAGLTYSFMLSVGNDTQWTPVITETSERCIEQFDGAGAELDCNIIPVSLYEVIACCYNQNYLKCPTWNPKGIEACQYTYQFVKECMT